MVYRRFGNTTGQTARVAIAAAAMRAERRISIVRICFCFAVALREIAVSDGSTAHLLLGFLPTIATIGFSLAMLVRKEKLASRRLLLVSVTLDAAVCFALLLSNLFHPADLVADVKVLRSEDTNILFLVVLAAGMRLSPHAAVLGGGLGLVSCIGLASIEQVTTGAHYSAPHPIGMYLILLATAGALTTILAIWTQALVRRAALEVAVAERSLASIAKGHHDASTLVSSIEFGASSLTDKLAEQTGSVGRLVHRIQSDVGDLRAILASLKVISSAKFTHRQPRECVNVKSVAAAVETLVESKFSSVEYSYDHVDSALCVRVAGGRVALWRIMSNLVVNACEGNGARGATSVQIDARRLAGGPCVVIEVTDDGPGFSRSRSRPRAKRVGSGLGIAIVRDLVEASSGAISYSHPPQGGVVATVQLPAGHA